MQERNTTEESGKKRVANKHSSSPYTLRSKIIETLITRVANKVSYNMTLKRLARGVPRKNPIVIHFQKRWIDRQIQKAHYRHFPFWVYIETTSLCNSKCIMCPHPLMKRKKTHMDLDLYKKAIDECARYSPTIILNNYGEPLLDPYLIERIRYAKERNIRVEFNTNGSLMTREKSLDLFSSGVDMIRFSLDGDNKETYERIRRGLSYDVVTRNVSQFLELRKRVENPPEAIIQMVSINQNRQEENLFIKRWRNQADKVIFQFLRDYKRNGRADDYHKRGRLIPCDFLWRILVILSNGDVVPCCYDYEGVLRLGNVGTHTLREIWEGSELESIRYAHLQSKLSRVPFCAKCTYNPTWL